MGYKISKKKELTGRKPRGERTLTNALKFRFSFNLWGNAASKANVSISFCKKKKTLSEKVSFALRIANSAAYFCI